MPKDNGAPARAGEGLSADGKGALTGAPSDSSKSNNAKPDSASAPVKGKGGIPLELTWRASRAKANRAASAAARALLRQNAANAEGELHKQFTECDAAAVLAFCADHPPPPMYVETGKPRFDLPLFLNAYEKWHASHGAAWHVPPASADDTDWFAEFLPDTTGRLDVVCANSIEVLQTEWIWDKRMEANALSLVAGMPDLGKSTIALGIVAAFTKAGGMFPDGQRNQVARKVLIFSSEDSWETTVVPRLMAAGADMNQIFKGPTVTVGEDRERALNLLTDLPLLEAAIRQHKIDVVLLDTLLTLPLFRVALNPRFTRPFYAVPRTSAARTASG